MKTVRYGIIGVGHLGKLHTQLALQIDNVSLIGIYDENVERARQIAGEFQTKCYDRLDALLECVEAVSIVVPTVSHYSIAEKALQKECHIFIEKPITQTIKEAKKILEIASSVKKTIQVGHIERFNPAILALDGFDLAPMFIESHRLSSFNPRGTDVAVILDLMIHDIDVILSLVKSPVSSIDASGVAVVSDAEDIANARIRFENGCVANVTASRISQKSMRKMRLFQRDMYISIDFLQKVTDVYRLGNKDVNSQSAMSLELGEIGVGEKKKKVLYERPQVPDVNSLKMELETFVSAIRNGIKPVVSGEDGLRALEVAATILDKLKAP